MEMKAKHDNCAEHFLPHKSKSSAKKHEGNIRHGGHTGATNQPLSLFSSSRTKAPSAHHITGHVNNFIIKKQSKPDRAQKQIQKKENRKEMSGNFISFSVKVREDVLMHAATTKWSIFSASIIRRVDSHLFLPTITILCAVGASSRGLYVTRLFPITAPDVPSERASWYGRSVPDSVTVEVFIVSDKEHHSYFRHTEHQLWYLCVMINAVSVCLLRVPCSD